MRIALTNANRSLAGGAETYVGAVIPALLGAGHEVAFLNEWEARGNRSMIPLPEGLPHWSIPQLGEQEALRGLRDWAPDLIYSQALSSIQLEAETLRVAPGVFFLHAYAGTCISGNKTFQQPAIRPCGRRFGWQCLLNYFPRRCGGLNPVRMLKEYRAQMARLRLLRRFAAIVTASHHMRSEILAHDFAPDRVHALPFHPIGAEESAFSLPVVPAVEEGDEVPNDSLSPRPWRLLFLGRHQALKGGRTLLEALPRVRTALGRPLRVTFAGDGQQRRAWEQRASALQAQDPGLDIRFVGWVDSAQLPSLWSECDLVVFPSLWPEPFGLVGLEAGTWGLPTAAFEVGGVGEWLKDGVNGHLAPGDPPTAAGLAGAIVKCLHDSAAYARLCRGASRMARQFTMAGHVAGLLEVFDRAARHPRGVLAGT